MREFLAKALGERHACTFVVHNPIATLDGEQTRAQVMLSHRKRDGIEYDPEQYFRRNRAKVTERAGCQNQHSSPAATQPEPCAERKARLVALPYDGQSAPTCIGSSQ